MSDEPELRDGPPWAMEEMIRAELGLPATIAQSDDARRLAARIAGAEKVLHGHLPAAGEHTGLVLLRFDPDHAEARDARSDDVAAAEAAAVG